MSIHIRQHSSSPYKAITCRATDARSVWNPRCREFPPLARWGLQFITLLIITCSQTVFAQKTIDIRREYNVKAVSVYGFCRFVTWPKEAFEESDSDLVVGIFGESHIERTLTAIARKKTVDNRKLRIVRCQSIADLKQCHIVFVSKSIAAEQFKELIQATENEPVVLVGEASGFGNAGGVANFFISNGRVRFELNPDAATSRGLKLDAKLLSLGTEIRRQP